MNNIPKKLSMIEACEKPNEEAEATIYRARSKKSVANNGTTRLKSSGTQSPPLDMCSKTSPTDSRRSMAETPTSNSWIATNQKKTRTCLPTKIWSTVKEKEREWTTPLQTCKDSLNNIQNKHSALKAPMSPNISLNLNPNVSTEAVEHSSTVNITNQNAKTTNGGYSNRVQTRLDNFFVRKSVNINKNPDFTILIVDSLGKSNRVVAQKVEKWITDKRPGAQVEHKFNRKIQQTDKHSCGPISIFNADNLTQTSNPDEKDIHIPTKESLLSIRLRCHDMAYLQIKGYDKPRTRRDGSEIDITRADLNATEDKNWFTKNLVDLALTDMTHDNSHIICDSNFYNNLVLKGEYNRDSRDFFKDNFTPNLLVPILTSDSHWIIVSITRSIKDREHAENVTDKFETSPTTKKHITIVSQNINGKYVEATNNLDVETYRNMPDIICWQETHTNDHTVQQLTNPHILSKYTPIYRNLTDTEKTSKAARNNATRIVNSEGVLTFVNKELMANTRIIDISRRSIAIAISTSNKEETLIINVYAPATSTDNHKFWTQFHIYLSTCKAKCRGKINVIIAGDLNTTILDWHNGNSHNYITRNSRPLADMMEKYGLHLPSHKPSAHTFSRNFTNKRTTSTYEATLDHFLISANTIPKVTKSKVIRQTIVKSDHYPIKLTITTEQLKVNSLSQVPKETPKINNLKNLPIATRKKTIREAMKDFSHTGETLGDMTNSIYNHASTKLGNIKTSRGTKLYSREINTIRSLKHSIIKIIRINTKRVKMKEKTRLTPTQIRKNNENKTMLTKYVRIVNKIFDKRFENRKIGNITFPKLIFTNARLILNLLFTAHKVIAAKLKTEQIRKAISKRNDNLVNNPKLFFRRIVTGHNGRRSWLTDTDGIAYTDTYNKLRIHTNFWEKLYNNPMPRKNLSEWYPSHNIPSANLSYPITIEEYQEALGCSFKSPGPSNVTFEIIKELPKDTSLQILDHLNQIMRTGVIPEEWRAAKISLLPKDNSTSHLPHTYRPISLLDTLYKTLSGILHARLSKHVRIHNIVSKTQSGYTKGISTANNIITLNNVIEDSVEHSKELHVITIDLIKAYDKVQHWAVEQALQACNIDTGTINLIMNMHLNAKAFIALDGHKGDEFQINTGVRQGDVLAPLLFLLVINPLLTITERSCVGYKVELCGSHITILAYCDDLLFISNSREEAKLMANILSKFLEDNSMDINPTKTLYVTNQAAPSPIVINKHVIIPTCPKTHFKYLGVWFSLNLNWDKSANIAVNSALCKLSMLEKKKIPVEAKVMVINMVILKAVEYTLNFIALSTKQASTLAKAIGKCIKHSIPMNNMTCSHFLWCSEEDGGLNITHPDTLGDTAIIRTLSELILKDSNSIAYKTTFARMLGNRALRSNRNAGFLHTKSRPPTTPSRKIIFHIDRVLKALYNNNLDIFSNAALHLTLKEMIDKVGQMSAINETTINTRIQLFPQHQFITRQQFINEHSPTVPLLDIDTAFNAVKELAHDAANFTYKTSDPFPLNPSEFNLVDFQTINNLIPIWTDGSCRRANGKLYTGWGVFFKPESRCNSSGSTTMSQNNFHAELEAIEFALSVAPFSHNIVIFTDSLSSMQLIQSKKVPRSHTEADFTLRITNLLQRRNEEGQVVTFTHVYSHVKDKTKRASSLKLALIEIQRETLTNTYGKADLIYDGNDQADLLAGDATTFEPMIIPFPTSSRNFFAGKHRNTGYPVPVNNIGATLRKAQHKKWKAKSFKKYNYPEEDHLITKAANAASLSPNTCLKMQHLALAGRHQCHVNLLSPNCDPNTYKKKIHMYASPNCTFCSKNVPEDSIHILGECPMWQPLRRKRNSELRKLAKELGLNLPRRLFLCPSDNYAPIRNSKSNKYTWPLYKKMWASTGKLPHHSIASINQHISDRKALQASLIKITTLVVTHQLDLIHTRNTKFNSIIW